MKRKRSYKSASFKLTLVYVVLIILWVTTRAFTNAFADPEGAERALLNANYHPIEIGGFKMLACSSGDLYATEFTAYSPDSSRIVSGVVCSGLIKGSTIRTF